MKKMTLLFFAIPFISITIAHTQCLEGNCNNGQGTYRYASGAKYVGEFANGKGEGIGICYWKDGSRYDGEWKAGLPHGQGTKLFRNGQRQIGWFQAGRFTGEEPPKSMVNPRGVKPALTKNKGTGCISGDCQNGKGVYVFPSGAVYTGEFRNGEIHGTGVCHYSDGSQYKGHWEHRQPHGQGTMTYADGSSRTGQWRHGQAVNQYGQLINAYQAKQEAQETTDVEIQAGCLAGDCYNGRGTIAYVDGSRYEGRFSAGKPNGAGTFYYPNGERYNGEFRNGVPHGKGVLYQTNGKMQEGYWNEGEYLGTQSQPDKGCIEGDCANGNGTYIFKEGDRYLGTFRNGLPHGRGTVFYANGERYEGDMEYAKFNGYGTLFMEDGTEVSGYWKDGVYLGPEKRASISSQPAVPTIEPDAPGLQVWAVVIGVASYNHMPVLRYTDDDAYRMYAFLKSPEGGALDDDHIRILVDEEASLSNIKRTMSDIFGQAGPNDLVLLYFSGHGLRGSFLPYDFDGYRNKLLHEEINAIFKRSSAKYKLCIADACHSGSLLAMRGSAPQKVMTDYYRKLAQAKSGTALIMSSKSDETSLESSGLRQGVFSHFLIRGLKGEADTDNDKFVTVKELYDFVNYNVRSYTGNLQSPLLQGDYDPKMPVARNRK
jgi:hypothetical protein